MNTILFFAVLLSTTYLPPCMSECPEGCRKEPENVTFSFRESIHNFVENLENATIFVDKINGSTDPAITLLVFGFMQGELIKQEITFDPNDSINAINFKIPDDDIALEPIEEFELFLYSIDGLFEPNNKTTIKIMDDDELLIGLAQNVTVMEGNNAILCVNFSSKFETNFKINVENLLSNFTLDNPAIPGEDFDLSNFSNKTISTVYGPNNSMCFKIFIFEDEFVEHEECFEVSISLPYSVSNHLMVEISEDTAVVCIKDNDRVVIGFEEPEIQVSENITDGVKLLCVKVFEGELMYEARVKVQYYNQTADADEDYKEEIINFTFSQNDTRVCFNVSIIDDNIHEHDEVLFINIATSDPQVTLSPNLTILTIKSDDVVNIVFIDDPFVGREVDDGFIAITVGVMEPEKLKTEVSVNLTTVDIVGISNAATSGVDYRPLDETLVFNEIVTVITVNVTLLDDNALEGDEDFKAQLFTNLGSNVGLGSDAILTIVDDDRVTIGFEEETVQVPESIGNQTLCVNVSLGQLLRPTTVNVSYQDQTAISTQLKKLYGQNYSVQQMTFTFSKDNTRECFTVDILDDDISEPEEKFLFMLTTGDPQVNLSPDTAIIAVIDNDVTFSFGEPEYTFIENINNATINVDRVNGSTDRAITLTVSGFVQGEIVNEIIIFGPNDTKITVTFEITDDVIPLEPTKEFELSLNGTDTEYNLLFEPNDKTTIYIVDDDGEHDEDVCLSIPTSEITIDVVVIGKTAEEVCDNQHLKDFLERTIHSDFSKISKDLCHIKLYNQSSCSPLELKNQSRSRTNITIKTNLNCGSCIQHTYRNTSILEINRREKIIKEISIRTLKQHEYNQTSGVNIRYFYGEKKPIFYACEREETSFVQVIGGKNLTLCNCSMECEEPERDVTFSFGEPEYSFVKTMGNATIHVKKTNGSIDRVITLLVTGFAEGPQTVDFYPQDTEKAITFKIFDDKAIEPTEQFELLLSPTDRSTLIEPHDKTTIIIMEDDVVNIVFIGDPFEGREGNGFVAITVGVMEPEKLGKAVSVNLTAKDFTGISNAATAGVDYRPLDETLTFSETVTVITVNVTLLHDNVLEGDEDFKAQLSTSSGSNVGLPDPDAIITIVDDDRVTIGFEEETVPVYENINQTLCVNMSFGQLARTTTISVSYQDLTAINGEDYSAQQMTFTFAKDNTRMCFNVGILDDNINEPQKKFLVKLTTGDPKINLSPDTAVIKIIDNDGITIGFEEETVQVPESIRNQTLCVNVSFGQLLHTTTVNVSYQDQTAINGQDYSVQQMTFTYSKDDTRECFDVDIFDDDISEPEHKFFLMLTTGDPQVNLSPNTAVMTITDNDLLLIGLTKNVTVMEGNNARLCVDFSYEFEANFKINVSHLLPHLTLDDPATPGEDFYLPISYIEANSTIHGPNSSLCFNLLVIEDGFVEYDECFQVGVSLPYSVSSHLKVEISEGKETAFVCIKDNDTVVIGFEETEVQVPENITDGMKLLCVKVFQGKLMREATVTVKYNDQTVVTGEDYNEDFLTFSQNDTRVCFNVSIIYDNIQEQDEVFLANITTSDPQVILSQPLATLTVKSDDVTFSFGEPEYTFIENMNNATINIDRVNGFTDRTIALTVSGFVQGELINETIIFGPNDTERTITFEITDDVIPLEPTEEFELSLNGTDTEYNLLFEPNDKTTIYIVDDDGEHEDICLSTPTSEITIYVVVVGKTAEEVCDNQHLKDFLERTIYSEIREISKDKCHLKPDYQASCKPLLLKNQSRSRTNITIKTNLNCGSSCIQHTYHNTSILEINRREKIINEINNTTQKQYKYNQTSDVVIRYFYEKKPVFYACEQEETSFVQVIGGKNLTLCNCSEECGDPVKNVTFSFGKPEYNFDEIIGNATITVQKISGSIDQVITLLVTGFAQGPQTVNFYPQDTEKAITFKIFDDKALEPAEKIELLLSPTDRITLIKPHDKTTINIIMEDEVVNIIFIGGPFEGKEVNDVAITVGVMEPEKLEKEVSVNLTTKDIVGISNAATADFDYKPLDETLTFNETVTNITINVTLLDDNALEGDENFKAQLSTTSGSNVGLPDPDAIITIVDDDRVTIGFEGKTVEVPESIRNLTLCVNVSLGQLARTTRVNVSYQDQTAINGQDYSAQQMTFTFSKDNSKGVCFDVDILNDNINEPEKKFLVGLITCDPQVNLSPDTAVITIIDNDDLLIGLTQNVTVIEGNNATLCVDFSSEFESNFRINVMHLLPNLTLDDPATPGEDFDLPNFSIEAISAIHGLNNSLCFNIFVMEDDFVEYEECFEVAISLSYYSSHLKIEISEDKDTDVVCIEDNDSVVIGFEETEVQVPENTTDGVKLLCVKVFEGKLIREATVIVQYCGHTAVAKDDYKDVLTFSQDDTRMCFNVSIIDDDIHEQNKVFFVNITTSDPQVTLSPHFTTLTIKSDDVVNIVFIGAPYEGREENGSVTITVGVVEPEKLKTDVSVNLTTKDIEGISNAARTGVDYRPLDETLTFNETVIKIRVNVTLLDDNALEGDEDFKAQLSTSSGSNVRLPDEPEAIITIVDDDRVTIGFEEETVQVPENIRNQTLCVNVSFGQLVRNTVVSVSYQDQTAINGEDYSAEQMTFTFSKENSRLCYDIDILDDDINEPEKKFLLMVSTGDPQINLSPDKAVITIIDNDYFTFSFAEPVYNFDENMGNATITVEKISGYIDQYIILIVSGFVQGELINETITFGPNDTEIPITIKITDNVIPLEEFELSLNGIASEFNVLFEPNEKTTIYIVDDDGEQDEDKCLSTPTSEMTIMLMVRKKTAEEACNNQHLKDFLERIIHSDIRNISKECHFKSYYQASCNPFSLGKVNRTAITIKTNLNCGSSCIQHTYRKTSILEINRQENIIKEISILTLKKHRYDEMSDVVIRYFYGEKKPVFYACEQEETSFIQVIGGKNLTLCNCSEECEDPEKNVTFTFDKSVYNFNETMGNATIHVEKTSGSIDRVITLLVTGFAQGHESVDFYPQDTIKAITFKILDEPTKQIELLLSPTDRITLIKPHSKTTINVMDDYD